MRGSEPVDDAPRQQFGDFVDRLLVDVGERVAQIGFGVESVQFGGADQAVDRCGAFATFVGAREEGW